MKSTKNPVSRKPPSAWRAPLLVGTVAALAGVLSLLSFQGADASSSKKAVERKYVATPPAPLGQTPEAAREKSAGCLSCHTQTDSLSMHASPAVQLGCVDCHGGNPKVAVAAGTPKGSKEYTRTLESAHVLPRYPENWHYPKSANPERTYTLLNEEAPEFIRFTNPSDYRVARQACGACHADIIEASVRSMHTTGVMLWGGASYNNGILPEKNYVLGESYNEKGEAVILNGPKIPADQQDAARAAGILPALYPLPAWETIKPGDIFRVFERGGRNINSTFPEIGIPNSLGLLQRIEEPGRPDFRQSNRGPGTGSRISVPVINITKTRLNDPLTWFMGTNDQPGDYRHSGCASCHVVYANDRDPKHSSIYAKFGHEGKTQTIDPTISKDEEGHPLQHSFTRAVPSSQCMICHMHQPNMFINSFYGYTMWDYESDAPSMWPEKQKYPTEAEKREVYDRNPEGAAARGKWSDVEFTKKVSELNPTLKDTQFADYHGHGWNFRAIFKRDRKGNLQDAAGNIVNDNDPQKFQKAVHMASIHMDVGMQCSDCHYSQDSHGNGYIYGEVAAAVEIDCKDCHGTADKLPNLRTSGPAALGGGSDLSALRTPDGRRRFEWISGALYQRSMVDPNLEWKVSLVRNTVTPGSAEYNAKAARAKLMSRDVRTQSWSTGNMQNLAHSDSKMECYSCHTSWTTSCGGCHLPIEANAKTERHHYEGGESRNFATYNPQVARDDMFLLGVREPSAGGKIAPLRSSSALVLSSTNANREKIYVQQAPIAASGFSSQAFNPHYPHTERKTETKTCTDCHLSQANDNNAIMAQLLAQGTNYINFVGYNAYVGGAGQISAVQVTEWDEPQAVIGSYLQKYAYPDWFKAHQDRKQELQHASAHDAGTVNCLQLRGEYLYAAEKGVGLRVYDVASIANKGVSQKLISAPFSPLGQDITVASRDASCMALPTTQPIAPERNQGDKMRKVNLEQPFHPLYNYAYLLDAKEGLILVDINTLVDGEPRNNKLRRAVTWNPNGVLTGARHLTIGGYYVYVTTPRGVVVVSVDKPLQPQVVAELPLPDARASFLQFRYLFVTDGEGLKVVDVTDPTQPKLTPDNVVRLKNAQKIFVARTWAYVAAGSEGLAIVDVERPERMREHQKFNGGGALADVRDVVIGATNASLFGYVADGKGGLKVLQLTAPDTQPKFYGYSPEPKPELIAQYRTGKAALAVSKGLERDRGVDETGGQIAVFGRRGSRPFSFAEMRNLYLDPSGKPWFVTDAVTSGPTAAPAAAPAATPARPAAPAAPPARGTAPAPAPATPNRAR
jgi:hypothetical protein